MKKQGLAPLVLLIPIIIIILIVTIVIGGIVVLSTIMKTILAIITNPIVYYVAVAGLVFYILTKTKLLNAFGKMFKKIFK